MDQEQKTSQRLLYELIVEAIDSKFALTDRRLGTVTAAINGLSTAIKDLRLKVEPHPSDGAGMIHQERLRQVELGYTAEKDDVTGIGFLVGLVSQECGYAVNEIAFGNGNKTAKRRLVIAGAMCAASIDWINRFETLERYRANEAAVKAIQAAEEGR